MNHDELRQIPTLANDSRVAPPSGRLNFEVTAYLFGPGEPDLFVEMFNCVQCGMTLSREVEPAPLAVRR